METISIILPASKKMIQVRLDRKSMKTCRLKVYPSQEVVLSMPKTVPADWVKEFLVEQLMRSGTVFLLNCLVKICFL